MPHVSTMSPTTVLFGRLWGAADARWENLIEKRPTQNGHPVRRRRWLTQEERAHRRPGIAIAVEHPIPSSAATAGCTLDRRIPSILDRDIRVLALPRMVYAIVFAIYPNEPSDSVAVRDPASFMVAAYPHF